MRCETYRRNCWLNQFVNRLDLGIDDRLGASAEIKQAFRLKTHTQIVVERREHFGVSHGAIAGFSSQSIGGADRLAAGMPPPASRPLATRGQ